MKILQIATFSIGANGPTSVLTSVIERLSNEGNTIGVLTTSTYNLQKEKLLQDLGVKYYYKENRLPISRGKILEVVDDLYEYDIVHIHGVFNMEHVLLARIFERLNIPYVVSAHGNLMSHALNHKKIKKKIALRLCVNRMLLNAKGIHTLNNDEKENVKRLYVNSKCFVIHNGINVSEKKRIFREDDSLIKLLFIGRLDVHHKGLDILLDAIEERGINRTPKIDLTLIGPFNSKKDEKYIRNRLNKNDLLSKSVNIAGPQYGKDKEKFYDSCDIFVHTSRYEGMPMAVLEALAAGMPSLITPGTNMEKIIGESGGGFVVSCDSSSINEFFNNPNIQDKKSIFESGQKGKIWCEKHLNWDALALKYVRFYNNCL